MEGERWERLAAGGGIVAAVLTAIGFLLPGTPPGPGDSASKVVAFYADKRSALLLQGVLFFVALAFYLWFLGALRRALVRAEGTGTTLSTAVTAAGVLLFA